MINERLYKMLIKKDHIKFLPRTTTSDDCINKSLISCNRIWKKQHKKVEDIETSRHHDNISTKIPRIS